MADKVQILNGEDMRHFIVNGYVTIKPDLPRSFHEKIYQKAREIFESDGNPGNNLLPRIPEIQEVFDLPVVHSTLTSILGPNYLMHSHRHPHHNAPGSAAQTFHKDSCWSRVRHHCPHWVLAFYYPQDVVEEIGPSAVLPGTQYYNNALHQDSDIGVPLISEAGTVTVLHNDLWHRAMANRTQKHRYMMKFLFVRMQPPAAAPQTSETWTWQPLESEPPLGAHEAMWCHIWNWLSGKEPSTSDNRSSTIGDLAALATQLHDTSEVVSLNAAYGLGAMGDAGVPTLMEALGNEVEQVGRCAAYGLSAVGKPAISRLIDALGNSSNSVRLNAVYTMAQMDISAQDAVPTLVKMLSDPCLEIRRHVIETLGTIGEAAKNAVPVLAEGLNDEQDLVRSDTALALGQIGKPDQGTVSLLANALKDENRYVRSHAAVALQRIGTSEAIDVLLRFYSTFRWCHSTTSTSTF